ncbi:MAG: hypothetical protein QWI73_06940, partial [Alphaproteobacteria bacterium]|nr:hypothetical protein [Alphaproteobacteria bacterium]
AVEQRRQKKCEQRGKRRREEERMFERTLGNVIIRGDTVISVQIEEEKQENVPTAQEKTKSI